MSQLILQFYENYSSAPNTYVEKSHPSEQQHPPLAYSHGLAPPTSPVVTPSQSSITPALTHSSLLACYIYCLSAFSCVWQQQQQQLHLRALCPGV